MEMNGMSWIRTYNFEWINLSFVWSISYKPVYTIDKEVAGHMILFGTVEGSVEVGCLENEGDTLDWIDRVISREHNEFDPCSEQEIIEIYKKRGEE